MTIYNWLLMAAWAVFLAYWIGSAFVVKRSVGGGWMRGLWFRVALAVLATILLCVPLGSALGEELPTGAVSPLLGIVSVALAVIGIGYVIYARYYLGRNWGMPMTVKEAPELVTTGPYATVRHPIYTGVLLAVFGSTLIGGWQWLVIFAAVCVYFIYSAVQEEKLMMKTFPDIYPTYKARTKMLIPYIL